MGEPGARFWPLVATLGAASTATCGMQTILQGVLQHLGGICAASAELWEMTSEPSDVTPRWRLRASHGGPPLALHGLIEQEPDAHIVQAAATLRTVKADESATLAIPLLAFGRPQGVLRVSSACASDGMAEWQGELESFAPVLGLYLHAAELNETLASGVLRDRLTGIANRAQLHDHLERELARARRTRRPFALMMIAPDRFDTLGVDLGLPLRDRVMQSLAAMLRDACRDGDMIGCYGSDRFLVVLPDCDGQGAQAAAQRYLAHFYRRPVTLPEGTPLYLDVSIGIALFPVDGVTIDEMVESAAAALHEARCLGGKRAVAA